MSAGNGSLEGSRSPRDARDPLTIRNGLPARAGRFFVRVWAEDGLAARRAARGAASVTDGRYPPRLEEERRVVRPASVTAPSARQTGFLSTRGVAAVTPESD